MINPLLVATAGYLSGVGRSTLSVSVDGYLIETIVPPTPPIGPGGHGWHSGLEQNTAQDWYREKIIKEDDEWLKIIKKYMDYRIKN